MDSFLSGCGFGGGNATVQLNKNGPTASKAQVNECLKNRLEMIELGLTVQSLGYAIA